MGSLTSSRVATASGSIRNFPFSSQYTSRIGLGGPVTADDEGGDVEGYDLGDGEAELDGESLAPRLKKLLISASFEVREDSSLQISLDVWRFFIPGF